MGHGGQWGARRSTCSSRPSSQELLQDDGPAKLRQYYPGFNESLFFFLPKEAAGVTESGALVFTPSGMRPLNVTNCDNRLYASA
eukprot:4821498-Pyramimonas_sp.AAC.1